MTGIDHLAEHLSVQDFQVDGHSGFQAGKGGSVVCCADVPLTWRPGLTVRVTWNVTNWRDRTWEEKSAVVSVDRYDEIGGMHVHFLADGSVRVLLSNYAPWGSDYPGPRDIPQKKPWKKYPWPSSIDEQAAQRVDWPAPPAEASLSIGGGLGRVSMSANERCTLQEIGRNK